MITNFEEITQRLTPREKSVLPTLVAYLENRNTATKSDLLCSRVNNIMNRNLLTPVILRKLSNFIRANSILPLIATPKGYYVSYREAEIIKQVESLRDRAEAINYSADGLQKFLDTKFLNVSL